MPNPDLDTATSFAERWGFPLTLVAIKPDGGRGNTIAKTFDSAPGLWEWIVRHNATRNVYFTVNPIKGPRDKKPSREDIAALAWLHVDIDPRKGEDIKQERSRARSLLQKPPNGTPKPTVIVDSGNGFQGFWKLSSPVQIDNADDAAAYNRHLEEVFDADACHNIDRLMRLPGTVNWPNAQKREKGRVPTVSKLVVWDDSNIYPLDSFSAAAPIKQREKVQVDIDRQVTIKSTEDLPVGDKCKIVIDTGTDPMEPEKYPSRSEAVWFVVCEMVRAGCDDATIFSVLTDPNFAISSAGRDKGRRWVELQIQSARSKADDGTDRTLIDELNDRFAVVQNVGGKSRILHEQPGRPPRFITQEDFKLIVGNRFIEYQIKDKVVKVPASKAWLESPARREYEGAYFHPEEDDPSMYNEWTGFAVEPNPGDCSLYLQHIRHNIAADREDVYDYILNWMALAVQQPARRPGTAIVMRGGRGTGKSIFANEFGELFGDHYFSTGAAEQVTGRFNSHLKRAVLVFADEAFRPQDRRHESVLKTLITAETLAIEQKGFDVTTAGNFTHLIMASNEDQVVPAGPLERRFLVVDVAPHNQQDIEFFTRLVDQMKNGGREALLYMLQNRDISNFDHYTVPQTEALDDQKISSINDPFVEWWFECLSEGELCGQTWDGDLEIYCQQLLDFAQRNDSRTTGNGLGRKLKKFVPGLIKRRKNAEVVYTDPLGKDRVLDKPRYYYFPSLETCRDRFKEIMGMANVKFEEIEMDEVAEAF